MTAPTRVATQDLRLALVLLVFATAVVVAVEFIVVGLLPVLARDLGTSLAKTGWIVGAFAGSAAILGPPLTLAATSLPPRRVLTASLLVFAASNLVAVMAPEYPVILAARIVQGAVLPVFISVGGAVAVALAPPHQRGRVLALANIGFVIGVVVALPAGVALAEGSTWTPSFLALSALALVAAGLIAAAFPGGPQATPPKPDRQAALLLQPLFLSHLMLSVIVFAAIFAAYIYLAAWLEDVTGMGSLGVAAALAGFGLAGLIGNAAAAWVADRAPLRATVLAVLVMAMAAIGISLLHQRLALLALLLAVWGAAHMAAITLCQVRVTLAGERAPAFALALNIASANLGIALGSVAGGLVVDRWGVNAIGFGALGLALAASAFAFLTEGLRRLTIAAPADAARCGS